MYTKNPAPRRNFQRKLLNMLRQPKIVLGWSCKIDTISIERVQSIECKCIARKSWLCVQNFIGNHVRSLIHKTATMKQWVTEQANMMFVSRHSQSCKTCLLFYSTPNPWLHVNTQVYIVHNMKWFSRSRRLCRDYAM